VKAAHDLHLPLVSVPFPDGVGLFHDGSPSLAIIMNKTIKMPDFSLRKESFSGHAHLFYCGSK
jgi:hypothetical protein